MVEAFQKFIDDEQLIGQGDRVLVAVSGGIDSMVLLDLFAKSSYHFAICHCNFRMRGLASTLDQKFVAKAADRLGVAFYVTQFDTKEYARTHKMGIQEAARHLRYRWFDDIMQLHHYDWLATAHHQDDQIETIMLNIGRGAGIGGLVGMLPKRDQIIRPMLFAAKRDIRTYADQQGISYREDESNRSNKYRRNYIRNKLIPQIEKRYPRYRSRMTENIRIWQKGARLLQGFLTDQIDRIVTKGDVQTADLAKLEPSLRDLVLFEWLRSYGFNYSQVSQMVTAADQSHSGRTFISQQHRVLLDRGKLMLTSIAVASDLTVEIAEGQQLVHLPEGQLHLKLMSAIPERFATDHHVAYIDAQRLRYPLTLRKWRPGDRFHPLGLAGKKQKLKKYFAGRKFSKLDKERQWLLVSQDEIFWVVGHRIDHRFRITSESRFVLRLTWEPG